MFNDLSPLPTIATGFLFGLGFHFAGILLNWVLARIVGNKA